MWSRFKRHCYERPLFYQATQPFLIGIPISFKSHRYSYFILIVISIPSSMDSMSLNVVISIAFKPSNAPQSSAITSSDRCSLHLLSDDPILFSSLLLVDLHRQISVMCVKDHLVWDTRDSLWVNATLFPIVIHVLFIILKFLQYARRIVWCETLEIAC